MDKVRQKSAPRTGNKTAGKKADTRPEIPLIEHFEKIVELTGGKSLAAGFSQQADKHIAAAAAFMDLTKIQTVLFAHLLNQFDCESISLKDISESFRCEMIEFIKYMNEIDVLARRRLIKIKRQVNRRGQNMPVYRIPIEVIDAIRTGVKYAPVKHDNLSIEKFLEVVDDLFAERIDGEIICESLFNELRGLFNDNQHLKITQRFKWYKFEEEEAVLLLRFINLYVRDDDERIGINDIDGIFEYSSDLHCIERELKKEEHILMRSGLVEFSGYDGIADTEYFRLSEKAKEEFLSELESGCQTGKRGKDYIQAGKITAKKMFYNKKDAGKVEELQMLLLQKKFSSVQKRLKKSGMRCGFACLFYGEPGTGKTETVYQLARIAKRDIMLVDISETKSMWYGESEKQIKQIFTRYKAAVKSALDKRERIPVLFLNEADALIGKRSVISDEKRAVDQTENTIQNILLQELENLDGILIATTNLTRNMDKAFERRFLYKIEFSKPDTDTRVNIWRSVIPALSAADAAVLAKKYEFSGGQIENIARRSTVDNILFGSALKLEKLLSLCEDELLDKAARGRTIGFGI